MHNQAPQGGRSEQANSSVERDLEVLGTAPRYYDWIVALLKPWFGQTLLECGAGSGHVTRRLLAIGGPRVLATDVEAGYLPQLQSICLPFNSEAFLMDLEALTDADLDRIRARAVDTILMVNVLEHVVDDAACLTALARALPGGGRILIMVPAHRALYSRLDRVYGHHRRYSRHDIDALARHAGLRVRWMRSMNLPGAIAWWCLHRMLGRTSLTATGTRLFNQLVPIVAVVERWVRPPFGQSIVAVLERESHA